MDGLPLTPGGPNNGPVLTPSGTNSGVPPLTPGVPASIPDTSGIQTTGPNTRMIEVSPSGTQLTISHPVVTSHNLVSFTVYIFVDIDMGRRKIVKNLEFFVTANFWFTHFVASTTVLPNCLADILVRLNITDSAVSHLSLIY